MAKRYPVEIVLGAKEKLSGVLNKATGMLKKLGQVALGLGAGAAVAVGGLAVSLGGLAVDAAGVDQVRQSFDALTASIGETSSAMLADLRSATRNMVSDADLMQSANQLISMGLADSSEQAAGLAEMAVRLGGAMGTDAVTSMNDFALMLANQSIPRLDTFGISSSKVRTRIDELMQSVQGMTREQAFMQAVTEQGAAAMERLGDAGVSGAAVGLAQLKATFENLKTAVGTAFLPALQAILTPLADLAVRYAPQLGAALEALGTAISTFIALVQGGIDPLTALRSVLLNALPGEFDGRIQAVMGFFQQLGAIAGVVWQAVQAQAAAAVAWYQANLPLIRETGQTLADFWQNTLVPLLDNAWNIITTVAQTATALLGSIITLGMQAINGDWAAAWETVQSIGQTVWDAITEIFNNFIEGVLNALGTNTEAFVALWRANFDMARQIVRAFGDRVTGVFDNVGGAIRTAIDWVQRLIDKLLNIQLPDFLTPGSPTPFEIGLRGIANAMKVVNGVGLAGIVGGGLSPAMAAAGGYGPVSVEVTINADVSGDADVNDLAWRVSEVVAQRLKALR